MTSYLLRNDVEIGQEIRTDENNFHLSFSSNDANFNIIIIISFLATSFSIKSKSLSRLLIKKTWKFARIPNNRNREIRNSQCQTVKVICSFNMKDKRIFQSEWLPKPQSFKAGWNKIWSNTLQMQRLPCRQISVRSHGIYSRKGRQWNALLKQRKIEFV